VALAVSLQRAARRRLSVPTACRCVGCRRHLGSGGRTAHLSFRGPRSAADTAPTVRRRRWTAPTAGWGRCVSTAGMHSVGPAQFRHRRSAVGHECSREIDSKPRAAEHGWQCTRIQDSDTFVRLRISGDHEVIIDLAIDAPPGRPSVVTIVGPTFDPEELAGRTSPTSTTDELLPSLGRRTRPHHGQLTPGVAALP